MLYKHFTEKLLGLQGLNITNIEENEKSILIYAEMKEKYILVFVAVPQQIQYTIIENKKSKIFLLLESLSA